MIYLACFGECEPLQLPDELWMAQDWMQQTITDLQRDGTLVGWRAAALQSQVDHMPRAGFSFAVQGIGLIKVERREA